MPLTALILVGEAEAAAAVLGVPALEFQMRRAVLIGATHIVLLVQRLPAALHAAADALRREGIGIDIARTVSDAVDFVHPQDHVLIVPPRLFIPDASVAALCARDAPALLCIDRSDAWPQLETVNTASRWTGCALLDGTILRQTAAMVGDWDFGSVLLRHLVQRGAAQMLIDPATLVALDGSDGTTALEARLIAQAAPAPRGSGQHLITVPLARLVARLAIEIGLRDSWLARLALALGAVAVVTAAIGWIALPAALMVIAMIAAAGAETVQMAIGRLPQGSRALPIAVQATAATVMLSAGVTLTGQTGQWGCALLAAVTIGAIAETAFERGVQRGAWRADAEAAMVLMAAGASLGAPLLALTVTAFHAVATLLTRTVRARLAKPN